jgi:hypothetical protein
MMFPTKADDLQMMRTPDNWPAYPLLPVKKRHGNFNDDDFCAIVVPDVGNRPVVYITNLFMLRTGPLKPQLAGVPQKTYESLEQLVDEYKVD